MMAAKKKEKKLELVIDRNKWLRGVPEPHSCMWSSEVNAGCCLGRAAHVLDGVTIKSMRQGGDGAPGDIFSYEDGSVSLRLQEAKVAKFGGDELSVIEVNDDQNMCDETRERLLTRAFAREGVKLSFTGPREESMERLRCRFGLLEDRPKDKNQAAMGG